MKREAMASSSIRKYMGKYMKDGTVLTQIVKVAAECVKTNVWRSDKGESALWRNERRRTLVNGFSAAIQRFGRIGTFGSFQRIPPLRLYLALARTQ
jgi:hypothetical protein